MSEQGIVGRADLQKKDKSELQAIVNALGGKVTSRAKKADLVDQILEISGVTKPSEDSPSESGPEDAEQSNAPVVDSGGSDAKGTTPADTFPEKEPSVAPKGDKPASSGTGSSKPVARENRPRGDRQNGDQSAKRQRSRRGRGGEPPAEWELELSGDGGKQDAGKKGNGKQDSSRQGVKQDSGKRDGRKQDPSRQGGKQGGSAQGGSAQGGSAQDNDEGDSGNRRRRRRGRNRDRDDEPASLDPVAASGYMELRDDGYGFLRVNGWMPSKEDVYVPVRMVRQWGLRKGDHVVGTARPANRNEKNPAMEEIETINGLSQDESRKRPLFEDLTPLFPDERLRLEQTRSPLQITPRIIDLVAPIGKGQRGMIVSPPKAGKTSIMKDMARSIEKNNPEVHLVVLLIDERPEEVTDMARSLDHGEVVASTFDRPPEEHCALAELTIERAKRMVEAGEDVVILLDGITRLARAYNMAGPSSGRLMSGGLDTAAIYPPKRFFGAARNLEEGGSLTILATALVETGSRMDEVIFEEFKGTGNMELRLDRRLAERGVFPAIDIDGSSTRRPELLTERTERLQVEKLRRVLGALADSDAAPSAGIDLLVDRLKSFKTNGDFLAEIAKS